MNQKMKMPKIMPKGLSDDPKATTNQVQIADKITKIKAGDFVSIPANVPHKYWSLTPQAWLVSMDAPYYDPSKTIPLEKN